MKWKFESRDLLVGSGKRLSPPRVGCPPDSENRRNAAQVAQTVAIVAAAQFFLKYRAHHDPL